MSRVLTMRTGRIEVRDYLDSSYGEDLSRDVLAGMSAPRKRLPSKYFYDALGSRLFEKICSLPEYYQTRTEMSILRKFAPCIMGALRGGDLVELGSGANWKIRTLLDAVGEDELPRIRYVPVDVSGSALLEASEELLELYEGIDVLGIVADFTKNLESIDTGRPKLILFLGSTIGNLDEEECGVFLRSLSTVMGPRDRCLIGMDMVKDRKLIEAAYNDSSGVTAEFNKNILNVVNRGLAADFDPDRFDHLAVFNEEKQQVEMHLRANREIKAEIRGLGVRVCLEKGETVHTEICRKFRRESAARMFHGAGLAISNWFADQRDWFSLVELRRAVPGR